jgi:UMF1 family MFS transporter
VTEIALPQAQSAAGGAVADWRGQISWAVFESSRAPYLVLVYIWVFAPYFTQTVIGDPVKGQEIWSLANGIVGAFVAVLAPVLGAVSDRMGRRKPWLMTFTLIMAPCCWLLWYGMPGGETGLPIWVMIGLIMILAASFEYSQVFYNAMLPWIAPNERIGYLSGLALAINGIGGLIALVLMLVFVALPASTVIDWSFIPDQPIFGLDPTTHEHERISGPIAAIWMLIFIMPLLLWTPDRPSTNISMIRAVGEGLSQLWTTIKNAGKVKNVGLYLLARMLYNDGLVAIVAYAGIFTAGTFKWDVAATLLFGVLLSFFTIAGGFVGGWLDQLFGSKRAILISLASATLGLLGAVSMAPNQIFFVPYEATPILPVPYFNTLPEILYILMFMSLATTVTAAFANSRAMMARIAPASMMSQFFGLYAFSGTATAFLAHGLVSLFTAISGSQAVGFASLIILMAAGFAILPFVREERAPDI